MSDAPCETNPLTPSEVALAKVLAAVVEWSAADAAQREPSTRLCIAAQQTKDMVIHYGLLGRWDIPTPEGAALLDRARRAGVV